MSLYYFFRRLIFSMSKKKTKKSEVLATVFAVILILGGVAALIYPIVGDFIANQQRSNALVEYDDSLKKLSKEEISSKLDYAQKYNANIWSRQEGMGDTYPGIKYKETINVEGVIGTIDIPSISIDKMPIYHGTNELVLNEGLGHFEKSSIPIGGNNTRSVISGHSGLQNQVLFSNVQKLKEGDIFFINVLNKRLAYKIESIDEVLPTDVDKVKVIQDKDMVTLLTCTPPGINTYRLLVNGVRIPYEQAQKEKSVSRDTFSYTKVVIFSLLFAICFALLLFILYKHLTRKLRKVTEDAKRQKVEKSLKRLNLAVKVIFVGLILGIATLLTFSIYGYFQIQNQKDLGTVDVGTSQQLSNYNLSKIDKANYSVSDISSVRIENYSNSKLDFNQTVNNWGIGKIVIPDIDVNLPILAGMNNDNLLSGVATLDKSEQQGTGNFVLLSHNISDGKGNSKPLLLGRINELKEKSIIYTTDFKTVYTYEVTSNQVVDKSQTSFIEQPKERTDTPVVTLIRCDGNIGTNNRQIVQGKLINQEQVYKLKNNSLQTIGLSSQSVKANSITSGNKTYSPFTSFCIRIASILLSNILQIVITFTLILIVPIIFMATTK